MKKLLILAIVLALAVYLYFYPELLFKAREAGKKIPASVGLTPESTTLYKWRDVDGNWQVSDQPPPDGIEYETHEYPHDLNVLPSPETLENERRK